MNRLLILVCLFVTVACDDFYDYINEIFQSEPENEMIVPSCGGLEGSIRGCHECYQCDHDTIKLHRNNGRQINRLEMKTSSCTSKPVCCVSQIDLLTRTSDLCGKSNPFGEPRTRRKTLRSVLQGEYPWRAFVYRKSDDRLLCGATYVNEYSKSLITLASCVDNLPADSLEVVFVKGSYGSAVKQVIIHDGYDRATGENNIAILKLYTLSYAPKWIQPACLPLRAPLHGLPCLTISNEDKYINTVIPLKCDYKKNGTICASAPSGDYSPGKSEGLYCKEQETPVPQYVVYGLAVDIHDVSSTYANVEFFSAWIERVLKLH